MIRRRQLFGLTVAGAGSLLLGDRAIACSIRAPDRTPFSDRGCRRELVSFVTFLNEAPSMPEDAFLERADDYRFSLEDDWMREVLGERESEVNPHFPFLREFRISDGKLDPKPIRLVDINLIRRVKNRASYQFTLERYSYHAADNEGCNGLFTHDEFYGVRRAPYLATFDANRLQTIRRFPEWYLA